jgi:ketosteroid isomerase-like protein
MSDDHLAVREVQHTFWQALKAKDRTLFESLLAEGFISRSPDQADQDRAAFIQTLTSFPITVADVGSDNLQVHVFGDAAVISGVQAARLQMPGGSSVTQRIAITNVLQRMGDTWLIVFSHAVELSQSG